MKNSLKNNYKISAMLKVATERESDGELYEVDIG